MDTDKNNFNDLTRVAIYVKDIEQLTGRTERYSREIMRKMRYHYNKTKNQLISVGEVAAYLGLPLHEVIGILKLRKGQ
jgi:hypothetical protein